MNKKQSRCKSELSAYETIVLGECIQCRNIYGVAIIDITFDTIVTCPRCKSHYMPRFKQVIERKGHNISPRKELH